MICAFGRSDFADANSPADQFNRVLLAIFRSVMPVPVKLSLRTCGHGKPLRVVLPKRAAKTVSSCRSQVIKRLKPQKLGWDFEAGAALHAVL